uniref:Tudor-knot domain-containing protein n=1 Tax=Clastoptera arizonana TaxID=38151 RepID=A0A1B6CTG9_9HEMI
MGQHTILSTEEENKLLNNIISKAKKGIASTKNDVVKAVLKLTKSDPRNLYFSKELTATKWFAQFKRRHRSVFDKYEHIIEINKESDSDSDVFSSKAKKIGRPKKNSAQSCKETTVKKESNSQHISDDESHSLDDQSDIESKKSILGEDIDKQFAPGSLLEVMDFNQQWYPVKVLEVDYEENEVLVHYQKWSDRYDEWVRMDSNRIRKPNLTRNWHFKICLKIILHNLFCLESF